MLFLGLDKFEWSKSLLVRFPPGNRKFSQGKFLIFLTLNTLWKFSDKGPNLLKFVCLFQINPYMPNI